MAAAVQILIETEARQWENISALPESDSSVPEKKGVERAMSAKGLALVQNSKLSKRDRVVLDPLPLVRAIAVRVHENLPVHVDLDDLVHAGILGLFDAATKFNPEKQVAFSSYAKHRIKGAILDSLRHPDWALLYFRPRPHPR